MSIVREIKSYVFEDELKITVLNNRINILNYTDINHFDNNEVMINSNKKRVLIKGKNLVVSKLMNDEVLITGIFNSLEFR